MGVVQLPNAMLNMRLPVLAMLGLLNSHPCCAQSPPISAGHDDASPGQFTVGPRFGLVPERFFLLIRKGHELGAIHFTMIERDSSGNGRAAGSEGCRSA